LQHGGLEQAGVGAVPTPSSSSSLPPPPRAAFVGAAVGASVGAGVGAFVGGVGAFNVSTAAVHAASELNLGVELPQPSHVAPRPAIALPAITSPHVRELMKVPGKSSLLSLWHVVP
jgi:hypothetical protein